MKKDNLKMIIWVTIYAIGMAFIESAVVVYLRAIYYPGGFEFPLQAIDYDIGYTEFFRELATIIMLIAIGYLAAKTRLQRFAYFIYSFAIWDIFYYIFLKLLLDWPASFMTWDILFLIPVTWVGPVISPVICSLLMITLAIAIIKLQEKYETVKIKLINWLLLISGSIVVVIAFTIDYFKFLREYYSWSEIFSYSWTNDSIELSDKYIPKHFSWLIFLIGIGIILFGIIRFIYKTREKNTVPTTY